MSRTAITTYLFSDIAGSTRLWEADPAGAARAIAWHDELSRSSVQRHGGAVVKMTGDGMHAAFADSVAATAAAVDLQRALATPPPQVPSLAVRCGLHAGADQRRDGDYFGAAVNRAARIMSTANGGQILVSGTLAHEIAPRLPADVGLRDLGLVRLKDLSAPERLFQVIHPALRTEFPPLRSLADTPNNLPQQLDSYIGRDREMAELAALLAKSRLVTVLAVGGVGKSRLAVQLAAELVDDFPDGAWLIELAGLQAGADIADTVAAQLGIKEGPVGDVADALVEYLRERELLLVLDNCEHVLDACAQLCKRLMQSVPRLRILATSRDALRIAGEWIYSLGTLPVPDVHDATPTQLEQHASVQLFLDRATAAQPAFRLTDGASAAVGQICRELDGIPLALELAAARTRSMPVATIAGRLDERFRMLRSQDPTLLPRQRTLEALIDWSYDLLNDAERTAFEQLSIFAGGWTVEAAEAVLTSNRTALDDVLELVSSLTEKSLVAIHADTGRYRMLDTVRHYALNRLRESSNEHTVRERHLAFFVDFVENARPHLVGTDQGEWMTRLDEERENLMSALAWCDRSASGAEYAARLVSALKYYWLSRGTLGGGYAFAKTAVELALQSPDTALQVRTRGDAGMIAIFVGKYDEAREHLECGLSLARDVNDAEQEFVFLQYLAEVESASGHFDAALNHCEAARCLAAAAGKERMRAVALNSRGQVLRAAGRLSEADALYREALASARSLGDVEFIAGALINVSMVAVLQHRPAEVPSLLDEVVAIEARLGSQATGQSILEVCAGLAAELNVWDRAAEFIAAAETQARRSGLQRDPADQAFVTLVIRRVSETFGVPPSPDNDVSFDFAAALHRATDWVASLRRHAN